MQQRKDCFLVIYVIDLGSQLFVDSLNDNITVFNPRRSAKDLGLILLITIPFKSFSL